MKSSALFFLLLSVSCGKYDMPSGSSNIIGEARALSSTKSSSDISNLSVICAALSSKSFTLPQSLNSSLSFNTSQKDCSGNDIENGNVDVVIQGNGSNYTFKRKADSLDFIFPNVETNTSGVLQDVCPNISSFSSPLIQGSQATFFTTTGISSSDCAPTSGEICLQVSTGRVEGSQAIIHTKEWIRFRVSSTQGKIGFFTQRKKVARSYCGENESLVFSATLK
jgi:hypothetical protein